MKTVLITGGSRGIGRAMVRLFAERGYRVAFTYKKSNEAAMELSGSTGALAIRADSTCEQDVARAVAEVREKLGNVNILINNSAVSSFSMFTDISLDEWHRLFSENVDSAFLYTKAVLSDMIRDKEGCVINVSSVWGEEGSSCEVHYSATKAAIIGMTRSLAKELGPSGIRVNCIAPGVIDTDMNGALSADDMRSLAEQTPLMRIGRPEEVASAALFLAEDTASFITGAVLNVSGGFTV